jgi:multidrug efflux pump subunit AcrA (membrane-fusion protein)
MSTFEKTKLWLGRKSVRGALVVIIIGISIAVFLSGDDEIAVEEESQSTIISVITPIEFIGEQSLSLIGNVRAFSEARVTSEKAGRVVNVNVTLGQQVAAGTVLGSLENAAERASVLQAEGVYDAAVAASAQSGIGIDEAQTSQLNAQKSAVSAFNSAYNTVNGVVINSIDTFFANPNGTVPGLRIDGRGFTPQLNTNRVTLQTTLPAWKARTNTISSQSELASELDYASQVTEEIIDIVDTFLVIFTTQEASSRYTDSELIAFSNTFTGLRSSLISVQSSIDAAQTSLTASDDAVRRAQLAGTGGTTSAADAQVKQALGALQSAQANLAKTILRTPISGTINSLSIRTGDFMNSFAQVAVVANNNALEVITYISDSERQLLSEGDTVLVEGTIEGVVTQIAPAVDSITRKTEVRIATEDAALTNGDTVRITKQIDIESATNETIQVPLTALKFDRENGSVFVVVDGVLVSRDVVRGNILGGSVEILEGITINDAFVVDARGLVEGDVVEIRE